MTDYVKGLLNARQDYLNTKFPEKITTAITRGGLGAPTPRKVTEFVDENTDSVTAESHAMAYDLDNADYATDTFDYEIQAGDTLSELSLKYNTPVSAIVKLNENNPAIKTQDLIYAGGTIKLLRPKDIKITSPDDVFEPSNIDVIMNGLVKKYNPSKAPFKIPFEFVKAIGTQESGLKYAEGADDEKGIMQVRPIALEDVNSYYSEFKRVPMTMDQLTKGTDTYNIDKSIEAGVAYLAMLRDKYGAKNLKELAMMYNGGPNAVRSGNKKANVYANSVMGLMQKIEPFKFAPVRKEGTIETDTLEDAFEGSQESQEMRNLFNVEKLGLSVQLTKELKDLQKEINDALSMDDSDALRFKAMRTLENTYQFLADIDSKQPMYTDKQTFEDRVKKSFPEGSVYKDRVLDKATEEEKQSIVARPKRFIR